MINYVLLNIAQNMIWLFWSWAPTRQYIRHIIPAAALTANHVYK